MNEKYHKWEKLSFSGGHCLQKRSKAHKQGISEFFPFFPYPRLIAYKSGSFSPGEILQNVRLIANKSALFFLPGNHFLS